MRRTELRRHGMGNLLRGLRAHADDPHAKIAAVHPLHLRLLDLDWSAIRGQHDAQREVNTGLQGMLTLHAESRPRKIGHHSFSNRVSAHVVQGMPARNPPIGSQNKLRRLGSLTCLDRCVHAIHPRFVGPIVCQHTLQFALAIALEKVCRSVPKGGRTWIGKA